MRGVIIFYLLLLALVLRVEAKTSHFKWEVEYMFWSPDGEEHPVMAINGQFPGPTIRANVGDVISIDLINKLATEGVVIHWHGINQIGTPWADGTASISQCAINPGESFTYRFTLDMAGTFFYHGHYGMQRSAGLYGSFIVEALNEPFHYDGELNLLLSDWWHESSLNQELGLSSVPFRWIHEPHSILLNGRGQYNCSLAAGLGNSTAAPCKFRGTEQNAPPILRVLPNKTYRLRLASTTALASLNLAIANHKLTVVEADGNYVEPFVVDDIDIYSGETYSVLITTNQDPTNNYWVSVGVRGRQPGTPPALTLLNYNPTSESKLPTSPPPATPRWNDFARSLAFTSKILSRTGSRLPPPKSDRRILLLNTQNTLNGAYKWAINNVSLTLPATPYLGAIKFKLSDVFDPTPPPETFPPGYDIAVPAANPNTTVGNGVYNLGFNTTIDVVLQNANALAVNNSEIHPWHLHGHDFWVLGYGWGKFREGLDERKFNLKNPPFRNTAVVFPYGWTAFRFVANNPGVWAFHCHIEPHLHMGMGVVFAEAVEMVKGIPQSALACGMTAQLLGRKGL